MEKQCKKCGCLFKVKQSHYEKRKTCSRDCKKKKTCPVCFVVFNVKESHFERRICCSKKCQNINQKNKIGELNNNFKEGLWIGKNKYKARLELLKLTQKIKKHTKQEWIDLKIMYNFSCACCKNKEPKIKLTKDHIIPISKGGGDGIENIQPLCNRCNCKKSAKKQRFIFQLSLKLL